MAAPCTITPQQLFAADKCTHSSQQHTLAWLMLSWQKMFHRTYALTMTLLEKETNHQSSCSHQIYSREKIESGNKLRWIYLKNKISMWNIWRKWNRKTHKQKKVDAKIPLNWVCCLKSIRERESMCVWERNTTRATIIVKNGKAWLEKKTRGKYCSYWKAAEQVLFFHLFNDEKWWIKVSAESLSSCYMNNSYLLHSHYSSLHRATLLPAADWTMQIRRSNHTLQNKTI